MLKGLILLISLVSLLVMVNSVSAAEITWTNCDATDSWCDPCNWAGNVVPGPGDIAVVRYGDVTCGSGERGPIIDCNVNVGRLRGPGWHEEGVGDQVMDIISGDVYIGELERDRDFRDANMTINISGDAHVTFDNHMRFPDRGGQFLNISGDATLDVGGDLRGADEDEGWMVIDMSSGTVTVAGELSIGDSGTGIMDFSGGSMTCNGVLKLVGRRELTKLIVRGTADVTVNGDLELQEDDNGDVEMYMLGGTCTVNDELRVGMSDGSAVLNVSGGILTAGKIMVPENDDCTGTYVQTGGVVECCHFRLRDDGAADLLGGTLEVTCDGSLDIEGAVFDIKGGTLILAGDKRDQVEEYRQQGKIVACGGRGFLSIHYDPSDDKTTVIAFCPCRPWPWDGAINQSIFTCLSWCRGSRFVVRYYLYFGDNFDKVNTAADPTLPPGRGSYGRDQHRHICPTSFDMNPMELELWKTYYWRVDQVGVFGPPLRGDVRRFSTGCELLREDFNKDCIIDFKDLAEMGAEWQDKTYWP